MPTETTACRPTQARRSRQPRRSLPFERGRDVMSRLSPPHRGFHRAGRAGQPRGAGGGKTASRRRSARLGFRFRDLGAAPAMAVRSLGPPTTMSVVSRSSLVIRPRVDVAWGRRRRCPEGGGDPGEELWADFGRSPAGLLRRDRRDRRHAQGQDRGGWPLQAGRRQEVGPGSVRSLRGTSPPPTSS